MNQSLIFATLSSIALLGGGLVVVGGCHDPSPGESPSAVGSGADRPVPAVASDARSTADREGMAGGFPSPPHESPAATFRDAEQGGIQFVNALPESGITFKHTDGGGDKPYILQSVVAGVALFDYDQDGFVDIYFLNGSEVAGNPLPTPPTNALYRNNGDWTFTDVSAAAGVADTGYGLGVAVADFDNDGDPDLYVNNFGPNVFYRNNGDGTFSDVTSAAGVQSDKMGAGVVFLDSDADGDLDLYVANYVDFGFDNYISRRVGAYEYSAAPSDYNPQTDLMFRNNGDGTFSDITQESGLASLAAPSMGTVAFDCDDDRDADIMICCDNAPNLLLQNDGTGRFAEVGLLSGIAHDLNGGDNGSMGVDCGDYDNDGKLDLFVTNYQGEISVLYRNMGRGFFGDVSHQTGAGVSSLPHVKWGTGFVDFDLDADRDLFIACGHFIEHIAYLDDRTAVRVPNFVLENHAGKRFEDVSHHSGTAMAIAQSSKGAAFDDLDNDGDVDVVILNANSEPTLLRNETQTSRNGVQYQLVGRRANRDGVGTRVKVVTGSTTQVAEVHSGRGYQSHFGSRLHFGIGDHEQVDRLEIDWLGGGTEVIRNPVSGIVIEASEG